MSIPNYPKNWTNLKLENKLIFINNIENLICFHPPVEFKNLDFFLKCYNFKIEKNEVFKIIESNLKSLKSGGKEKEKEILDSQPLNDSK